MGVIVGLGDGDDLVLCWVVKLVELFILILKLLVLKEGWENLLLCIWLMNVGWCNLSVVVLYFIVKMMFVFGLLCVVLLVLIMMLFGDECVLLLVIFVVFVGIGYYILNVVLL